MISLIKVGERVIPHRDDCELKTENYSEKIGTTGEKYLVKKKLDSVKIRVELLDLFTSGFRSIAIVFVHAYAFPDHEIEVEKMAREIGFTQISASHRVMPMIKMVPRGLTSTVDAYLTPSITTYVENFLSGFSDHESLKQKLLFMRSDGGLTKVSKFDGSRAVLSGPAGGVLGYAAATYDREGALIIFVFTFFLKSKREKSLQVQGQVQVAL